MAKILHATDGTYMFWCPACERAHGINSHWQFNGDLDKPTIRPSLLTRGNTGWDDGYVGEDTVCHCFVTDGKIKYLPDCTHALAGHEVDIPDWDSVFKDDYTRKEAQDNG